MKKLLMLCLTGMAAAVMAAEFPIEFKTKKDLACWGNKKYYQSVDVSVENGVAKVTVAKTVPGAKPTMYDFSIRNKRPFKAGVNYSLTFTLKSNKDAKVKYYVQQLSKPYKSISGKPCEAVLTADKPQTIVLKFSVKEDVQVTTRVPSLHAALKEGQTLELSDVKLAEEEAAK